MEEDRETQKHLFREILSEATGVPEGHIKITEVEHKEAGADMMNNDETMKFIETKTHVEAKLLLTKSLLEKAKTDDWYQSPEQFVSELNRTTLAKALKLKFTVETLPVVQPYSGITNN